MDFLALAAALTVMATIITAAVGMYQISASPRTELARRLGGLLSGVNGLEATAADYQALRGSRTGKLPFLGALLEGKSWTEDVATRLDRADMKLTVSEFMAVRVFIALVGALLVMMLLGSGVVGILVMVLGGFIGYQVPSIYVSMATGKRLKKLDGQLIEALSLISNSLKAGFGLMQSFDLASRELGHPLATELRRLLHDINVGSTTEDALLSMAKHSGSSDLDIVITAMLIQQSTGGNLAEILDNVGHTMRERIRIRGEIKTLTTQQMATGFVIGALPFAMAGLFSLVNPAYMSPLFTELIGKVMLAGAAMLELFGVILIKRILAIEV